MPTPRQIIISAALTACASGAFLMQKRAQTAQAAPEPESVPLVRLVVTPEKYQNKKVRVLGFVHLGYENNGVYIHREDFAQSLTNNGLWLSVRSQSGPGGKDPRSGKYCIIEGTFDATKHGHLGMWSGTIENVTRFEVWSDPAKPRK